LYTLDFKPEMFMIVCQRYVIKKFAAETCTCVAQSGTSLFSSTRY